MGWDTGFMIFEEIVIGAYDAKVLNKELLRVLMEPFRGTDIDSGGSRDLKSKDGKDVEQIVIETWGFEMPAKPVGEDPDSWNEYNDIVYDMWDEITNFFGWC